MAVPRNRTSNARKNSRRSHHAKVPQQWVRCSGCESLQPRHQMCTQCHHYAGRKVAVSR